MSKIIMRRLLCVFALLAVISVDGGVQVAAGQTPFNPLKSILAGKSAALGFIVRLPSAPLTQVLARTGPDWLWIDMEHGPLDLPTAQTMITATQGTKVAPLVRVPVIDPVPVKQVLDAGAYGVIFPMARTADDARLAVASTLYPPAGIRGVGPSLAAARWGIPVMEYIQRANDEIVVVLLIEHVDAVKNLDAILAVDGIDVAFIAPFDLSASLGMPGQITNERVISTIARVEKKILASGVALGGLAFSTDKARAMIRRGYRFIMLGTDILLLNRGASQALGGARR